VATDEPASVLLERIRQQRLQPADDTTHEGATKPKRKDGRGVFYRRAAVVCYVVKRLSSHEHFGRTQLEKILHLSQSHLGIDLSLEFKRYAAGPFDEVIYKLEGAARKNQWFTKKDRPKFGVTYHPAEKTDELCCVAVSILGDKQAALNQLLDHFARMDTDQAELLATAYAAWNDLLLDGRPADEEAIIKEIYGWDESKAKFDRPRILACLEWMRKQGYVPTGTGQRTQVLERKTRLPSKRKARKPKDTGG
jgi:type I restriction enzyme, S subunit